MNIFDIDPFGLVSQGQTFEEVQSNIIFNDLSRAEEGYQRIRQMQEETLRRNYGEHLMTMNQMLGVTVNRSLPNLDLPSEDEGKEVDHGPQVPPPPITDPY